MKNRKEDLIMSKVILKVLLAPVILPLMLIMKLTSLVIINVAELYEIVAGIVMKLVAICIVLALFTKNWLALILFIGILGIGYLITVVAAFLSFALDVGKDSLGAFMLSK